MGLTVADFPTFFEALNGYPPFDWQIRLLELVATTGRWPDRIAAPTGSGKTSVIDVHVFANALVQAREGHGVPRRLAMTVNRRALIDDHAQHAGMIARALAAAQADPSGDSLPIINEVADLLLARAGQGTAFTGAVPLAVHTVRGGLSLDRSWHSSPTAVAVICATPDMWGSRALFRGHGSSLNARPMEAGLLAFDSVLIVDEAHLNRQLLLTARRIAQLQSMCGEVIGPPVLQVVETTATPARSNEVAEVQVVVDEATLGTGTADNELRRRLSTPKPVSLRLTGTRRSKDNALLEALVEECLRLAQDERFEGAPIGCVVNTVQLALDVATRLQTSSGLGPSSVVPVIGGLRQYDRRRLANLYPTLLQGDDDWTNADQLPRFVVGTQALEVGINIDLAAMVSELAPAAALVQRAGRVNRFGRRNHAEVAVVAPEVDDPDDSGPYEVEDLHEALAWLRGRAADEKGLAPFAVQSDPPPAASPRRVLFQRLEWHDVAWLSRTNEDTVAVERRLPGTGEDLTLWLRDELTARAEAFVVVRGYLPANVGLALKVAETVPPLGDELYSVSLRRAREIADDLMKPGEFPDRDTRLIVFRRNRPETVTGPGELMPGDTLVVPPGTSILTSRRRDKSDKNTEPSLDSFATADVLDEVATSEVMSGQTSEEPYWQLRMLIPATTETTSERATQAELERLSRLRATKEALLAWQDGAVDGEAAAGDDEGQARVQRLNDIIGFLAAFDDAKVAHSERDAGKPNFLREVTAEDAEDGLRPDVTVVAGGGPGDEIFVLVRQRSLPADDNRSETSARRVYLDDHTLAVEQRAAAIARTVGLPTDIHDSVVMAAHGHDTGKAANRFQRYLSLGHPREKPLAKSGRSIPRKLRAKLGLVGWRHEQLSAAEYFSRADPGDQSRDLVTWLIGTSHGYGRSVFDATAARLLLDSQDEFGQGVWNAAVELYDDGHWDSLNSQLLTKFGPWGIAYLEAIVRSADQAVTREGR